MSRRRGPNDAVSDSSRSRGAQAASESRYGYIMHLSFEESILISASLSQSDFFSGAHNLTISDTEFSNVHGHRTNLVINVNRESQLEIVDQLIPQP